MADLKARHLDLLVKVASAGGRPAGQMRSFVAGRRLVYVYAYLAVWKQTRAIGWDEARSYVTEEAEHIPGLTAEVTGTIRRLVAAGLVELADSGRKRSERPYVLTSAGIARLAEMGAPDSGSHGAGGGRRA